MTSSDATHHPPRGKNGLRRWWVAVLGISASAAILGFLISSHLSALSRAGSHIRWEYVLLAAASALGSYAMMALALDRMLAFLGHSLSFPTTFGVVLVSSTANYLISTAGASGFALKAHLLKKRRVPYAATVTASVVCSGILFFVLALVITQGFVYLFLNIHGARLQIMEGAFGLAVLAATAALLVIIFFAQGVRGRITRAVFHALNRSVYLVSRSEIPHEEFRAFEAQLESGLARLRSGKKVLAEVVFFTCMDWSLVLLTLSLGFKAVGVDLPAGHISAGFTVGQLMSLIPVLPAGLGAMEGSMAAVFTQLGVGWGKSLLAALIYRAAYYLIPGMISVIVFWGLKMSEPDIAAASRAEEEAGEKALPR